MKLFAISDLHLDHRINNDALRAIPDHSDDWLVIGGDVCSGYEDFRYALAVLSARFSRLIWVPGNHELWSRIGNITERGEEKYQKLIGICREFGVLTPEDPYPLWEGEGGTHYLVPLFLLYDYSFRPDHVSRDQAVAWANEAGIMCTDEYLLDPWPHASRIAWCHERCARAEEWIGQLPERIPKVLINHFPLRRDLARLWRIPRFSIWCGTRITESWHLRYNASVVISGHLHIRGTKYRDGIRFEEVSLGYPRDWNQRYGVEHYLRRVFP
ncbi:MAG: metallophosphoesterase [Desulfobacteraceae bacterium]|nr:metallophosphoesterase [Desulfobacteraceae bacterium]